ncbi:hypothetical protein EXN66_Car001750 [Channa argus]|uniref:Uncharacterized protein n=1 Tax=Channa argus TaxID=215402 RepID=A0A6G1R2G2_CHAAH|nr:hypothetical protein EXN66_Car001750 [Channa argus]
MCVCVSCVFSRSGEKLFYSTFTELIGNCSYNSACENNCIISCVDMEKSNVIKSITLATPQ